MPTFEEREELPMTMEKGVMDDLLRLATDNEKEWRRFREGLITDVDLEKDRARRYHHPDEEETLEAAELERGAQQQEEVRGHCQIDEQGQKPSKRVDSWVHGRLTMEMQRTSWVHDLLHGEMVRISWIHGYLCQ